MKGHLTAGSALLPVSSDGNTGATRMEAKLMWSEADCCGGKSAFSGMFKVLHIRRRPTLSEFKSKKRFSVAL